MIDSHAHLNDKAFDEDIEEVLERAHQKNIYKIMNISEDWTSCQKSIQQSERYPELYCTSGIHPHKAAECDDNHFNQLKDMLDHPQVKAVGEIGLDYYYNFSPEDDQKRVFQNFMELSLEKEMPAIIHCRDAEEDMIKIFEDIGSGQYKGVIHCFTGSLPFAKRCLDFGFYISFSGIITFKNADSLREVVQSVDLTKMLIETDSPYLAPVPNRGKRNEPSFVEFVAQKVAEVKGLNVNDVISLCEKNTIDLFDLGD